MKLKMDQNCDPQQNLWLLKSLSNRFPNTINKTGTIKFKLNFWCEPDSLGCELWMLKSKSVENDADENVAM